MLLRITPEIRNEWQVRSIAGVIPSLGSLPWENETVIHVDAATAKEIYEDCVFHVDLKAVDESTGERAAYRVLMQQIDAATVIP